MFNTHEDRTLWRIQTWCSEHEDFFADFCAAAEDYANYHGASIVNDVNAIQKLFDAAELDDLPFSIEDFAEYMEDRV